MEKNSNRLSDVPPVRISVDFGCHKRVMRSEYERILNREYHSVSLMSCCGSHCFIISIM